MGFVFKFKKLLRLKQIEEEKKQKEYFIIANSYSDSMKELIYQKNLRDQAILKKKALERNGAISSDFDVIENFLVGNKKQCIKIIEEIKEKRKLLDIKKIELLESSKERSIWEKLEENACKKYKIKEEIKIINNIDEISTSYFGREN